MKTRTRGMSYPPSMADLVKREDTARRAGMRATARLNSDFSQPGGIEGAKRHSLYAYKREKEQIKQELESIRTSYNRSSAAMLQNSANLKLANAQFAEDLEERNFLRSQRGEHTNGTTRTYGRNYFGYKSEPGLNKPHFEDVKAIQDKYSPVKNYYEYKGPKQLDKKTREKLAWQQNQNMSVQERVKSFGLKNSKIERNLNGYSVIPPTGKKTEKQEKSVTIQDEPVEDGPNSKNSLAMPKPGLARVRTPVKEQFTTPKNVFELNMRKAEDGSDMGSEGYPDNQDIMEKRTEPLEDIPRADEPLSPISAFHANDSQFVLNPLMSHPPYRSMKPKTALDLVFDADKYAPDGRLRTIHCMPDTNKAYKEARQARYIRTRYKRDLEKELSVDEMFSR